MIKYIMLFILLAITAVFSIIFYYKNTKLHFIFKPLPIVCMLLFVAFFTNLTDTFNYLVIIAMIFCIFGDLFIVYDKFFFYGILSFLCTQLVYIVYFILNSTKQNLFIVIVLLLCGIVAFVSLLPKHNEDFSGKMIPACLIYTLALSFMVSQAICFDLTRYAKLSLMSFGAISFMLSDGILSMFQFKLRAKWMYVFILVFYYASQVLMGLSLTI